MSAPASQDLPRRDLTPFEQGLADGEEELRLHGGPPVEVLRRVAQALAAIPDPMPGSDAEAPERAEVSAA